MKKFLIALSILSLIFITPVQAANEWRAGAGDNTPLGTTNISDIDTEVFNEVVDPLDRLLAGYREGCAVSYATAATLTVGIGQLTASNSGGTIRKFRSNTSATTVTWANIDDGAEATSTTYYVYGVADADATTFTVVVSTNSSTPTGVTYFKRLGSFYNDASGNIKSVRNDNDYHQRVKGFINFNGDGTIAINKSFNVSSITDGGTGVYTITWDTDMSDAYYTCIISAEDGQLGNITSQAAGSVTVRTASWDAGNAQDCTIVNVVAFE